MILNPCIECKHFPGDVHDECPEFLPLDSGEGCANFELMASDQSILEMHKKLYPDNDFHCVEDLPAVDLKEIQAIIKDKHAIRIGSDWLAHNEVKVDLRVLRNIMVSASLSARDGLAKQDAMQISDLTDGDGHMDRKKLREWDSNCTYYREQLNAIKALGEVLDTLRNETNQPAAWVYMHGTEIVI